MSATAGTVPGTGRRSLAGLARGGLANLAGAAFSGLAGLAVTALLARTLDREHAGAFFTATSAFLLAQMLAKLGTDTGLVYWLCRLRTAGRSDLAPRCLRIALPPILTAATVAAVALLVAPPVAAGMLRPLAVFLPVAVLSDALLSATRGYRTMRPTVLVDRIARPALQLALLTAAALVGRPTGYPLAWVAPYLVSAALAAHLLRAAHRRAPNGSATPPEPGDDAPRRREAAEVSGGAELPRRLGRAFWVFTAPRAAASVAQVLLQRLDVLLVATLLGLGPAAVYTVATRFVVVGQMAGQALAGAAQPRLAERLSTGDTAGLRRLYQGCTAWTVLCTWPVYLLVMAFAPVYLAAFGSGYAAADGRAAVPPLCAAMLVASACGTVDMLLTMGGRTTWNLANVALAVAVNVALDLLLIPSAGILGAAVGWAVALLVKNLVPLVQIAVVLRLHPFGRGTLAAAALCVVAVGGPALAARLLLGAGPAAAAVGIAGAALCFPCGCALLRRPLGLAPLPVRNPLSRRRDSTHA